MSINIRQLEAFHAVLETGSVTMAGARLGITQPAVSKLLKSLSETCGFKLFIRSGGQMLPTAEARLLSPEVERLFTGTDRVRRLAEAVREQRWGQVDIAAPPALTAHFLPVALAPLLSRQNVIQMTLTSNISPRIIDLVESHQVDIGLSTMPFFHSNVHCEQVLRYRVVCALPAGHPLAAKEAVHVDDLRHERMIGMPSQDCMVMTIDRTFQQVGVPKTAYIQVPMSETACDLVARGAGVAIVPPFVGQGYGPDQIVRRPLLPTIETKFWMLMPTGRPQSIAAQRLADAIRAALAPFDVSASAASNEAESEPETV